MMHALAQIAAPVLGALYLITIAFLPLLLVACVLLLLLAPGYGLCALLSVAVWRAARAIRSL